ncbi:hypothetical protein NUM3379_42830 [Kineococcus sp. NUM-3379]
MLRTGTMAYLVGRVITATEDGRPVLSVHDGRPVCLVDQGETFLELHPGSAEDLLGIAHGVRVAEFRRQLGDADADALLGYLLDTGLVVLDPAQHPGALDRLRLAVELTDLGPTDGTEKLRTVRTGSGQTVVLTWTTVEVVRRNTTAGLGAAIRSLAAETGTDEQTVRAFLHADLHVLIARGGGRLYRVAAAA